MLRSPTGPAADEAPRERVLVTRRLCKSYRTGHIIQGRRPALVALFDPAFDPAAEVILSGPGAPEAAAAAHGASGRVRIAELRADRVRLEAELDGAGVVVLADAWDPGWRAWVDGRPAPVRIGAGRPSI